MSSKIISIILILSFALSFPTSALAGKKPKWINKPPKEDDKYLYVVGGATGASSFQNGKATAINQAVSELLNFFGFTSSTKFSQKKTEISTKITEEIESASNKAQIKGTLVQELYYEQADNHTFNVFVLVRYPKAELQQVLIIL
jgi:hypothetical protein